MHLKVIQPFGGHAVGTEITDESKVSRILNSEQAPFVVKVVKAPDEPKPVKDAKK
jgi:hypothetical protein